MSAENDLVILVITLGWGAAAMVEGFFTTTDRLHEPALLLSGTITGIFIVLGVGVEYGEFQSAILLSTGILLYSIVMLWSGMALGEISERIDRKV